MKTAAKLITGAALLATGYFVGFYEMKYKMLKCMCEGYIKKETENKEESKNTEE